VLVRPTELEIRAAAWSAIGMRGTESATVRAPELRLPRERLVYLSEIEPAADALPTRAVISVLFGGLCLGISRGALKEFNAIAGAQTDHPRDDLSLEVELELDALAALLAERLASVGIDASYLPSELQAAAAFIAERSSQAVFRLSQSLGTRATLQESRFGLLWRDLQVAASHAYVKRAIAFENVRRARARDR
jgi:alkylation response protein AidB-like acyl-CoA dehydrogenase